MSTKRFPKLRPTGWDALAALCVVLLAAGLAFFQWRGGASGDLTVLVSIDGAEADRFLPKDLLERPRSYTNNGYTLEIAAALTGEVSALDYQVFSSTLGIRVSRSDCPTQDCVHTGTISRSGQSIVCLPARIVLRLEGGGPDPDGVDAVLG